MTLTVQRIKAADTHDLRLRVLRDGDPAADLDWPGDHDATTVHLGVSTPQGRLVGVSTWLVERDPMAPHVSAVQLRGMATDPDIAGQGVGSMLLAAGLEHARSIDAERVWANARVTALEFYERADFTAQGAEFLTSTTGLAHRHVHISLA